VIIMLYLLFASFFIAIKAIQADVAKGFTIESLFRNQIFYTLIVSTVSTYGIWIIASFLMWDPWHMFTSFLQYMLLTPTYVNVLNVYAFCNTHDVTWGTKGDDKPEKLPSVNFKEGKGKTDLPDEGDLNVQYERELSVFATKAPKEEKKVSESQRQEDYYSGVRSVIVLFWMVTNFVLAAVVLSTAGLGRVNPTSEEEDERANIYLTVVLWSVAGLSAFKFIGMVWFLIVRLFRGV